jgi:isoleucyl-tRNA synthetase
MSPQPVDFKKTVNLPKTDFPMKANLPAAEPKLLAEWESSRLYDRLREVRAGRPMYVLHDGPPYANGNIHLGTAFNKILKDFIVKSKSMAGFDSPYVPGWDCHGLPIEFKVDSELGKRKATMSAAEIRAECRAYAAKFVDIHRTEFKRLGILGRWDDPYLTMSAGYEAVIAQAFVDFLDRGYVYKGLKPVNWCIKDQTALAEAEVEYENDTSPSIYVRFRLTSDAAAIDPVFADDPTLAEREIYVVIWTTTPWTIPANLAIAFHPKYEYVAVDTPRGVMIVAEGLLPQVSEALGWDPVVVARFPGSKLEGAIFRHPFLERDSVGILADYVTLDAGTGAVHTAPGHGQDDFVSGQRYGLPVYCPVDHRGRFFAADGASGTLPPELMGLTVWQANPVIVKLLLECGALLAEYKFEHSYPHCWRCHQPTIFRATEQWFVGMDRGGLRGNALEAIKHVKWYPLWGEERMSNMIAARPDWCISRQRVWGVPIIAFYCEGCGEPFTPKASLERVVALFREHTADIWYSMSAAELLGEDARCAECAGTKFRKETDILDVWFDSGSSHLAVLTEANHLPWPADMYLEGGDQYRGWFHSSLLIGVALRGAAPYKECATHGWTLDAAGRAMSKSLGNNIEPESIIKRFGADVVRLWVASVDFMEDVRLSETILSQLSDAYRKIRNTFRYALGNLDGFDPGADSVAAQDLDELDQWILFRAEDLVRRCRAHYEEFAFHKVYQAIYGFATTDLSAIYFDVLKDRLYTTAPKSYARRSAQTALSRLNFALVRLLAPILSFTCDEVWRYTKLPAGCGPSVHLDLFPEPEELTSGLSGDHRKRAADWDVLMPVRDQVLKALEDARQEKVIGAPLEASVSLEAGSELYPLLERYAEQLPGLFIVSQVDLKNGAASPLVVRVDRARGDKCERCWKYKLDIGADASFPSVCASCAAAVREILA